MPSQREVSILKALWQLGPASVRAVHAQLAPSGHPAFNSVQTVLRIMERKGLVTHRTEGRRFVYTACYTRRELAVAFLQEVFDGQVRELLDCLIPSRPTDWLPITAMSEYARPAATGPLNPGAGQQQELAAIE